jgi:hypothetical protein
MTSVRKRIGNAIGLAALVTAGMAADVNAQPPDTTPEARGVATSFEQLQVIARPDAKVTVTDAAGAAWSGRIVELRSSSLSIIANGTLRDFDERDIAAIRERRGDPLGNGALWGAAITSGLAALSIGLRAADCDCGVTVGAWFWVVGANAAFGAGLGVAIDALIRREQVIYEPRSGSASSPSLTVRPVLSRRGVGVSLSMGF